MLEEIVNLISDEFLKEDKLDQEVREILNKHIDEIRKGNIEYQTMFKMIKTKLAKERNIVIWWAACPERKFIICQSSIVNALYKNDLVEFLDEPNEIRLTIVKAIEEEMKLYDQLDRKAREKNNLTKKHIEEGSQEWEILYRKYYNEELAKLTKLSE